MVRLLYRIEILYDIRELSKLMQRLSKFVMNVLTLTTNVQVKEEKAYDSNIDFKEE